MRLDEMIYQALKADTDVMEAVKCGQGDSAIYPIVSTCFEVSPTEQDNTPVPYIIVSDNGFQQQQSTKDCVWESPEDAVQASVEVAAESPQAVGELIRLVRRAVERYMVARYTGGDTIPTLDSLVSDGIAWDWTKPCYYQTITYHCTTQNDTTDE